METDKEPDVCVKTVLTFGDKPAPAMAQSALRKTAEENKKDYPEVTKVLINNSYTFCRHCSARSEVDRISRQSTQEWRVCREGLDVK